MWQESKKAILIHFIILGTHSLVLKALVNSVKMLNEQNQGECVTNNI